MMSFIIVVTFPLVWQPIEVSSFSANFPSFRHGRHSWQAPLVVQQPTELFSASAPAKRSSPIADDDSNSADMGMDIEALLASAESAGRDISEDSNEKNEMLAAIDETPIGELSVNQVLFLREVMSSLVDQDDDSSSHKELGQDAKGPIAETLLFRILDEWQFAVEQGEVDTEESQHRNAVLEPTVADFVTAIKAWEQDALRPSFGRQKDPRGQDAVKQVIKLLGILEDLWEEAGMKHLKPNQELLETVLRVFATSRERGMDRRVLDLFQSLQRRYGLEPTCAMYQSAVLALARSKAGGSSQRAENVLKEGVQAFPPHRDATTGMPSGIPIETFNKVLVSWAKSGPDGPERAEKLLVYMDTLDRDLKCNGLVAPNLNSFTTLIDAYAQQNDWDGISCAERMFNRLLDEYLVGGQPEEPNIASWTIVIAAWGRLARKNFRGAEEKAAKLLKRMESLYANGQISFGPDAIAYVTCLRAWATSSNQYGPTQAEIILDEMHEKYMDGDDSMQPSIKSIQIVLDSWIKMGTEEAMEQAELLFDRYEDHLESLKVKDGEGSGEVSDGITDIYRSMLVGWTKCDPERSKEYLLDMIDRKMKVDCFCFDKIIEALVNSIPTDKRAMKRIYEVFELLEKCRQSGVVTPNERVYTSFIRAMTKARMSNGLAKKSHAVLQRMKDLYEGGNNEIKPTIFTYNAVLNACAETPNDDKATAMEAFKVAIDVFNEMRDQHEFLDHLSFGNMLRCSNLMPEGAERDKFIALTFQLCCKKGLLNSFVIRDLQNAGSEELWRNLLQWSSQSEVDVALLPPRWSMVASAKQMKKPQGHGGGARRGFRP